MRPIFGGEIQHEEGHAIPKVGRTTSCETRLRERILQA